MVPYFTMAQKRSKKKKKIETVVESNASFMIIKGYEMMTDGDKNTIDLLNQGSWSNLVPIGPKNLYRIDANNNIHALGTDYSLDGFEMFGAHNTKNILAAITAANVNGISIQDSVNALKDFKGIKRRLELKYEDSSMMIIDD